jgi:outer membrane protein assembly factor BamB
LASRRSSISPSTIDPSARPQRTWAVAEGTVYAFDAVSGDILWSFRTEASGAGGGVAVSDGVLYATVGGLTHAFDRSSGTS